MLGFSRPCELSSLVIVTSRRWRDLLTDPLSLSLSCLPLCCVSALILRPITSQNLPLPSSHQTHYLQHSDEFSFSQESPHCWDGFDRLPWRCSRLWECKSSLGIPSSFIDTYFFKGQGWIWSLLWTPVAVHLFPFCSSSCCFALISSAGHQMLITVTCLE